MSKGKHQRRTSSQQQDIEDFDEDGEFDPDLVEFDGPSKSQIKRDMLALTQMGEELCAMPLKVVERFNIDDKLMACYEQAQSIHSNVAKKRHRQYMGKVLRKLPEEEVAKLKQDMHDYANGLQNEVEDFHYIENARDAILKEGDKAITALLNEHPFLERSHLRQLMRNAHKEREKNQAPKSARLLFKYLKENISS